MATAFAVTGIHRSRLKYYRPNYISDLAPIYEDLSAFTYHKPLSERYPPTYRRRSDGGAPPQQHGCTHDYEEIDVENMDENKPRAYNSLPKTNGSMLNGIMNNRFRSPKKPVANYGLKTCEGGYKLFSNGSAGVRPSEPTDTWDDKKETNNNNVINSLEGYVIEPENKCNNNRMTPAATTADALTLNVSSLSEDVNGFSSGGNMRALPVSEVTWPTRLDTVDEKENDDEVNRHKAERSSSLYQVTRQKDSVDYGVVTDDNGFAVKHWPKLEPEPPSSKHVLCPAESKLKHRCFAACFVVLILLIGIFVTGMIEGWMYTQTGVGFDGSKEPVFTVRGVPNLGSADNGTDPGVS